MRELPPDSRARRWSGVALVAALAGALAAWSGAASATTVEDLRGDIPTGESVRSDLDEIAEARDGLLSELTAAERALTETLSARDGYDEDQRRLASQIEAATAHLRFVAVQTFVAGGDIGALELLLSVSEVSDLSWRRALLRNHAGSQEVALRRLEDLELQASDEVKASIAEAADLRDEIVTLEIDLAALAEREAELETVEPLAEAWDRAAIAIEEGRYGIAPQEKWEKLRFCESTHNYRAVNSTGKYRGAYQFDLPTWQTVGGTGDPAAAPPEEQDARARELYARRGSQPWPECGYWLE